jgi:phosphoribosylformylglycinamidine synthase
MEKVIDFAAKGGYVFGICNGFQILCEAGLLPGALLHNNERKFICKNIYIKAQHNDSLLTAAIPLSKALKMPVAHGEGKYFVGDVELKKMNENGQVIFHYCDEHGEITQASNPNGSLENIAGICNAEKNVFGMMPHPERASDPELGNTDGKILFESLLSLVTS